MKTKFTHDELEGIGFKEYRNFLYKEMARLKKESPDGSVPVQFLLIGQFKFQDTGDKKIPMLIIGDRDAKWKPYVKEVLKRKERDFAVGSCGFGADGQSFNVVIKKGKIASTTATLIDNLILKPAKLSLNVTEALLPEGEDEEEEGEGEGDTGEDAAAVAAAAAAKAAEEEAKKKKKGKPTKEEKIASLKEAATAELTAISGILKSFKEGFARVQKEVSPKLKSGEEVTRTDMVAIKQVSTLCDEFDAAYKKAGKLAQKEVSKGAGEVAKARKDLQKLAVAAQAKKKTLAQTLADKFFEKRAKRKAKAEEVQLMQASLQAAIAAATEGKEPAQRAQALQAVYLTAALLGPNFKPSHVQVVGAKLATKA